MEIPHTIIYHPTPGQWHQGPMLLPQAAWLLRRRRGLSPARLQFGSTADGLVPNKPPKSADVLKAADTDGSALILPFSPAAREESEKEKQRQINSFVTELCSFTRQDKAAVQVGCRWDQLSTVCLILYGVQSGEKKKSLNYTMIYWQGHCCLTEPCNFRCGCSHSQGDQQGCLDVVQRNWLGWLCLCRSWTRWPPAVPFHPNHSDSMILPDQH